VRLDPHNRDTLRCLATSYAATGQIGNALSSLEEAVEIAKSVGDEKLVGRIAGRMELCR
jgi:Tfp pilus assembly protein PilF